MMAEEAVWGRSPLAALTANDTGLVCGQAALDHLTAAVLASPLASLVPV